MSNREDWLQAAAEALRLDLFRLRLPMLEVPPVHVSVGWPSRGGTSTKKRVVGQCWRAETSADGVPHIFISPMEGDALEVLSTLTHEMIHALHPDAGHKGEFVATAKEIGFTAPWTSTPMGEDLIPVLTKIVETLGEYPHSALTPTTAVQKPQTTRMLKVVAEDCCGYTVRTTRKWLEEGTPKCPHGEDMIEEVK